MASLWCLGANSFDPSRLKVKLQQLGRNDLAEYVQEGRAVVRVFEKKWGFTTSVSIDGVPSQCGLMIVHELWGVGPECLKVVDEIAKTLGYSKIMATLNHGMESERDMLQNHGWKCVDEWINARSDHRNYIFTKDIDVGVLIEHYPDAGPEEDDENDD